MNKKRNIFIISRSFTQFRVAFVLFCVFMVSSFSYSQQIETKTDTTKIRIGEQIILKYIGDKKDNLQFPKKLQLDSLQKLEVVKSFDIDTIKDKLIKKYAITSFDSGRYKLPAQIVLSNGKILKTDKIWIDVSTVAVDTTKQKLFPIKAIQEQAFSIKDYASLYWYWVLGLLAILVAIWYFFIRKKETEEERVAKIPPFEMAVQQLANLDKKLLWQNNKTKEYYSELTDIIRNYIEKDLHVSALESTTNELVRNLKKINNTQKLDISKKTFLKLKTLLQEADLVKFAKSKPYAEEIEMHRTYADAILEGLKTAEIEIEKTNEVTENVSVNETKTENKNTNNDSNAN